MVNLIVDIDIILGSYAVARGKSGVFVVADNVIKRLAERPDLKISFSCTAPMFNFIKLLKKDSLSDYRRSGWPCILTIEYRGIFKEVSDEYRKKGALVPWIVMIFFWNCGMIML